MTSYDFIIVGAGSSGSVLADRLSRDGKFSVLVIEAGGKNDSLFHRIPRGMLKLWQDPRFFWSFPVKDNPKRPAGETWFYGKGLGGSSSVNGTWYFRGQPKDYDQWNERSQGLWNWREIERCYRAFEDYAEDGASDSRGKGGPVQITQIKDHSVFTQAVLDAGAQLGLPVLTDINQPGTTGIGQTQMTVDRRGERVSGYSAFLARAMKRSNVTVLCHMHVKRVVIEGGCATGVICDAGDGKEQIYRADREVIVSAGVMQSPKLLQLSGIGPAALLQRHGIAVSVANDHVGRHLSEHMMMALSYRLKRVSGHNREFKGMRLILNTLRYFIKRTGPMSYTLPETSAMASSTQENDWPDIQIGVSPYSMVTSSSDKPEAGRGETENEPGVTIAGFYLRPHSEGTVKIASADPAVAPLVDANWFGDSRDQDAARRLFDMLRRFMAQPALASFVGAETVPGAQTQTDDEIERAICWLLSPGLHGTGTCRMGNAHDSVVDGRLRVHGVANLRVVDCSAMPTTVSGNTNGPAMALAWRAAELIAEDAAGGSLTSG